MKVHRIALVGAGRMGALHAHIAAANHRFHLAAVADHNRDLAKSLADELGTDLARGMLSAWLATNATPRTIHMVPSVMMHGCTPRPTTIRPLAMPQASPIPSETLMATRTVVAGSDGPIALRAIAVATPANA